VRKRTVHKCIRQVTDAIIIRMQHMINWPEEQQRRDAIAQAFFRLTKPGIPSICGAIDGSLVPIIAPTEDEYQFVDRHGQHSINCQAVAGPDLAFYSWSSRWPGSVHDARVLRNSGLFRKFEVTFVKFILNLFVPI